MDSFKWILGLRGLVTRYWACVLDESCQLCRPRWRSMIVQLIPMSFLVQLIQKCCIVQRRLYQPSYEAAYKSAPYRAKRLLLSSQ